MTNLPGITGIVPVRNGNSLQYCWRLAVESLLGVCDQVIISDGESTDGTQEEAIAWCAREPKITVHFHKWENPVGDLWFLSRWINAALKTSAKFDMQLQLDADEVLDPRCYSMVKWLAKRRVPARFHRINLWGDPWTEAPHGTVCAHNPTRLGPIEHPAVCDNLHPVEPWINEHAEVHPELRIWHLGFLRDQKQFLMKSREMQSMLCNTYDPILRKCEETGESWVKNSPFPEDKPLIVHNIKLPDNILPWLRERGFPIE